jgi:hypothetical protein
MQDYQPHPAADLETQMIVTITETINSREPLIYSLDVIP